METNKIDKIVKDSLQSRTIQPSSSAWERLSDQLDVVEQPKRINWFKYAGYAASVLLIISVAFFMNSNDASNEITPTEIVTKPIVDPNDLVKPNFKSVVPVETVIVQAEKPTEKKSVISNKGAIKKSPTKKSTDIKFSNVVIKSSSIVIAEHKQVDKKKAKQLSTTRIKIDSDALLLAVTSDKEKKEVKSTGIVIPDASKKLLTKSRIQINSDALLYAVSNPTKDISEYYKKYNINRDEVLKNIQKELQKMNLKIDASTLLTDVEKTIDEETFKRSFMQVVKGKVTGLAAAFANRNN